MNDLEQHFKKAAEHIRMTSAEKDAMRFRIQQITAPSSPAPISTPSPYVWMFAPRSFAMLGVALLVVLSTGSAYASGGSLPGTPLYLVKTKIVEPLKVALAPTVQAKAQANADIAATRVQEAQTLAAQGTLTPEASKQISDNYKIHADAALALAAHIDEEDNAHEEQPDSRTLKEHATDAVTVSIAEDASSETSDDVVQTVALSLPMEATKNMPSQKEMKEAPTAATSTDKQHTSRNFVRTLRASLSAQAQILEKLDVQVRSHKDND